MFGSAIYLRYSTARNIYFFGVLVFAVVLLFLIGDLAENLDEWMGSSQSLLLRLADTGLEIANLMGRIAPFIALLAVLFAWIRGAALGELTALEAAGASPIAHWTAALIVLVPALGFALWHQSDLADRITVWQDRIGQYKEHGRINLGDGTEQLEIHDDGTILARNLEGILMFQISRSRTHPNQIAEYRDGYLLYEPSKNLVTKPEHLGPVEALSAESDLRDGGQTPVERAIPLLWVVLWTLALGLVAFRLVVRHGRTRGMASQGSKAVLALSLLWAFEQAAVLITGDGSALTGARIALLAGTLTFLWPWRKIKGISQWGDVTKENLE